MAAFPMGPEGAGSPDSTAAGAQRVHRPQEPLYERGTSRVGVTGKFLVDADVGQLTWRKAGEELAAFAGLVVEA